MKKTIIGVSGGLGSFSEEAARHYADKNKIKDHEISYLISVDKVLSEIRSGKVEKGIFPIENSNGGIVYEAVYAMAKYEFSIENIFEIDVRHCLLARKGIKRSEITKIISHPQALKQCRMYLKRKWEGTAMEEYSDTAQAAKDLGENKLDGHSAVISPARCARIYGLDIVEEGIQDLKFNFTAFICAVI